MTDSPDPQNFQPAPPAAPAYQPAPGYQPAAPAAQPGRTLGIVALIVAFPVAIVGLILGIVALVQSKKAGAKNGFALAAIIVGALGSIGWIIFWVIMIAAMGTVGGDAMVAAQACIDGADFVEIMGQTVSCEEILSATR